MLPRPPISTLFPYTTLFRSGQLVVLESTTYPGTTRELMLPSLESTGLKVGEDFFLAFSPERVDPGNERFNTRRSEEHTSELQSLTNLVCRLLLEKKNNKPST